MTVSKRTNPKEDKTEQELCKNKCTMTIWKMMILEKKNRKRTALNSKDCKRTIMNRENMKKDSSENEKTKKDNAEKETSQQLQLF